ncbi:MAG TPA: hypothetical protein QF753_04740 [Victivallales bacterium]|nr:hypothetical protein [Victivallales bacterium]
MKKIYTPLFCLPLLLIPACIKLSPFMIDAGPIENFSYKISPEMVKSSTSYDCTVAVENFKNKRPTIGSNKMFFYLIPGLPYGWGYYNIPEKGKMFPTIKHFAFSPTNQLAEAAKLSLKQSGLFKNVYYSKNSKTTDNTKFIFKGTILSTLYRQKLLSYCIGPVGPILWLIGAPSGWTQCRLKLFFSLIDAKTGKLLWSYNTNNAEDRVIWWYYQGADARDYTSVMRKSMNEAIINLETKIKENSSKFGLN